MTWMLASDWTDLNLAPAAQKLFETLGARREPMWRNDLDFIFGKMTKIWQRNQIYEQPNLIRIQMLEKLEPDFDFLKPIENH